MPYSYSADRGCRIATAYLQKSSRCIECPFDHCVEERRRRPNQSKLMKIQQLLTQGMGSSEIARELGIHPRAVRYYKGLIQGGAL